MLRKHPRRVLRHCTPGREKGIHDTAPRHRDVRSAPRAPSWPPVCPVGGFGALGGPCRGYRLGAGSASCGCLIWGSATSDPVMVSRSQLAQARVSHWVASHTHTHLQSNQPNPNPPISVKGFFFSFFPRFRFLLSLQAPALPNNCSVLFSP